MTSTTDINALDWTPEELEQEAARDNRPSFRKEPIQFEGEWNGEIRECQSEVIQNQTYPRYGLPFTKTKFLDVGNGTDLQDGQEYVLLLEVPPTLTKKGAPFPKRLTQIGRTAAASGHELKWFAGSRLRVTEQAEVSGKNAKGYDQFRYFYKFEKIGDTGVNGASPDREAKFKEAEQMGLQALEAADWQSESEFRTAWLNNPSVNQISPDFNTEVMLSRWAPQVEHFKNLEVQA